MENKTSTAHSASRKDARKTTLAEVGLVLFVFFALLLVIVALSQALSAFHSVHHAAEEGRCPALTHAGMREFRLASSRSTISFGAEAGAWREARFPGISTAAAENIGTYFPRY